jgi:probable HAF family extracellular repeat protein
MVDLGVLPDGISSGAVGVSGDGSVVVGVTESSTEVFEAFRWTQEDGMVGLGDLPGGEVQSAATAISADGTTVVGQSSSGSGGEAFRWTAANGMIGLGDLLGGLFSSTAWGVSADGSVVVGVSSRPPTPRAFIWDQTNGMRNLQDVLVTDFGLDLTGWTLTSAQDISDDARVIVGNGLNPSGELEAWIADLGQFGDMDLDGDVDFDDINPFVLALFNETEYEEMFGVPPELYGDIDGSGNHDFDDIPGFVAIIVGNGASAAVQATPEPSGLVRALIGGVILLVVSHDCAIGGYQ